METCITEKILEKFNDEWMEKLIEKITTKVSNKFQEKLDAQDKKIKTLENQVSDLKAEIEEIKLEKDMNEQYSRRNNLRIFGVQERPEEKTNEILFKIIKDKLNIELNKNDIEVCHRIGVKKVNSDRPIMIKFTSNIIRNEVFYKKKNLKGSKITIREDLTKMRKEIVSSAVEEFGAKNVWTQGGRVYVHRNNQNHVIKNIEKLMSLME